MLNSGFELSALATSSNRSSRRAAMRCTAPMKAPGPPPTMPRRKRSDAFRLADSIGIFSVPFDHETKHFAIRLHVRARLCEIVEGMLRSLDDVAGDERRALPCPLFGALDTALPFEDGPSVEVVLRKFGEDCAEINLPVAGRTEAACTRDPRLISAVDALTSIGPELGVLHVKHLDSRVIEIDELEIVQLLKNEVTWIEQNIASLMAFDPVQKHLERDAIVKIFTRVDFKTQVDPGLVKDVEDRLPAFGQFVNFSIKRRTARSTLFPYTRPSQG